MPKKHNRRNPNQMLDPALLAVMDSCNDANRKFPVIVQCELPSRVFKLTSKKFQPRVLKQIANSDDSEELRDELFRAFVDSIQKVVGDQKVNAFKSSGSVAAELTAEQVRQILSGTSSVKQIRMNRRLDNRFPAKP